MKKYTLLFLSAFAVLAAKADFVQLKNGKLFEGKVVRVFESELAFKTSVGTFFIPGSDLQCVNIEKIRPKQERALASMFASSADACSRGTSAGTMHGHGFGQFCAGFFGSLLGVGIVMLVDKTPAKSKNLIMVATDDDVWTDPGYLMCYNKAAKSKALINSGLGCITYLVLYFASY